MDLSGFQLRPDISVLHNPRSYRAAPIVVLAPVRHHMINVSWRAGCKMQFTMWTVIILYVKDPGKQYLWNVEWRERRRSEAGGEVSCDVYPATVLTDLKGRSGAKRSFSFILNELRLPFFFSCSIGYWMLVSQVKVWLWDRKYQAAKEIAEGLLAEVCLPRACPVFGTIGSSLKGDLGSASVFNTDHLLCQLLQGSDKLLLGEKCRK